MLSRCTALCGNAFGQSHPAPGAPKKTTDYATLDFLTDQSLVPDPYPYFDYLRERNPVLEVPPWGVIAVTGYEEAVAVYKDTENFSNAIAVGGPFPP